MGGILLSGITNRFIVLKMYKSTSINHAFNVLMPCFSCAVHSSFYFGVKIHPNVIILELRCHFRKEEGLQKQKEIMLNYERTSKTWKIQLKYVFPLLKHFAISNPSQCTLT